MQLFITLLAMPVLIWWGLPVSALSILGNLIFAPLLSLFLLLSSLIFFFEIAYVPNKWLILMLEKITILWLSISPNNPKIYLLFFPQTTCFVFIAAILISSCILIYFNFSKATQVLILGTILTTSCIIAKLPFWIQASTLTLKHRHKQFKIAYQDRKLIIRDDGILNNYVGVENWICYTLLPALSKKFGSIYVKELYLAANTKNTARNLELFKANLIVKNVHLKKNLKDLSYHNNNCRLCFYEQKSLT